MGEQIEILSKSLSRKIEDSIDVTVEMVIEISYTRADHRETG